MEPGRTSRPVPWPKRQCAAVRTTRGPMRAPVHWNPLNADLSIPGLLAGLFGTKAYLAQQAGRTTSPAKAAAARANGAKGGRPRRSA